MRLIGKLGLTAAFASLMFLGTGEASAQGSSAPGADFHRVAVVDVAKIFKENAAIRQEVEAIENELKAFQGEITAERERLQQTAAKLKQLKVGTPDYAALEEQLASMDSKLRLKVNRKRQELADAEAKIYYKNYQKIAAAVEKIASYNKIDLVLRYNSEDMQLEKAESVIRGVMKTIVYHSNELDMTPIVMQFLDKMAGTEVAGAGSATKR